MTKTRREFTPEVKREAIALLESSGRPLMLIITDLGISPSMLRNWRSVVHGRIPRSRAGSKVAPTSSAAMASPADQRPRLRGCGVSSIARPWSAMF
ncbi:hypothetical protein DC522_29195 [Microvirga sp. KLBC 81]|nr:hypothetical protein DC522_29195 [Microvirga sp. KLBC 81]